MLRPSWTKKTIVGCPPAAMTVAGHMLGAQLWLAKRDALPTSRESTVNS